MTLYIVDGSVIIESLAERDNCQLIAIDTKQQAATHVLS
jgi:hypothetical protein